MNITRPWKIVIGVATFLVAIFPFIIAAFYMFFFFSMFSQIGNYDSTSYYHPDFDPSFFGYFFLLFPIMMCLGLLQFILTIFYIIHLVINDAGSKVFRSLTGIGLYFLPWIAMPAYFLIFIAPNKTPEWALEPSAPTRRKRSK